MSRVSFPTVAVQVTRPMNPTVKHEFRTNVVELMRPDAAQPLISGFRNAVLAANKQALASNGAAQGVLLLTPKDEYGIVPLGALAVGADQPTALRFDDWGAGKPVGGPWTDRFELKNGTGGLMAIVGANTYASFYGGQDGTVRTLKQL